METELKPDLPEKDFNGRDFRVQSVTYDPNSYTTIFAPEDFLSVAFDSGGVTTGPMTVPFIMSFGIGISAIRSDRRASDDSFGLISLCSVGPILAVLILGLIFRPTARPIPPP